jgi:hypothetical protein
LTFVFMPTNRQGEIDYDYVTSRFFPDPWLASS